MHIPKFSQQRGLTLVELMVSVAIVGVGLLSCLGAYTAIQKSIQTSKSRAVATNVAQEKMQLLMQKSYYEILVTTQPAYRTDFTPAIPYDPNFFSPETVREGGIDFTRLTYVQIVKENSGVIQPLPPTTPDTGMRQLSITVIWNTNNGLRELTVRSVINDPNTVMSNAVLKGVVTNSVTGVVVGNGLVDAAENSGWQDTTDGLGNYLLNLSPGNFNFVASAPGFYTRIIPLTINPNATVVQNFLLDPISTGTVRGTAWLDNKLVISAVLGSSVDANGFREQYVELFNPSTFTWTVATPPWGVPVIDLRYQVRGTAAIGITMLYVNYAIPPHSYYLFANTTTVTVGGILKDADAIFHSTNPRYPNVIEINTDAGADAAAIGLAWSGVSTAPMIDAVGWTNGVYPPPFSMGTPIPKPAGLTLSEQFIRFSSTSGYSSGVGRAYNSGSNAVDFLDSSTTIFAVHSSSDTEPVTSGVPCVGAIVSINDGVSNPATATLTGFPPAASFSVPGVATGTWNMFVDSGAISAEIDNLIVTTGVIGSPNATTLPSWTVVGDNAAILSTAGIVGTISGKVTDAFGAVISPAITVTAGSYSTTAGPSGNFLMRLSTGVYSVTANPGNLNGSYSSQTIPNITVNTGDVTANVNFTLPKAGKISGWITRDGVNPLPSVAVIAMDSNGVVQDNEVSDYNGHFHLLNLSTGTYTVEPILDVKEISTPATVTTVVLTPGLDVIAGTFTVTGAMGSVTGIVTQSGQLITSGVLIVASTSTIILPPPALSTATLSGTAIYGVASTEDGKFSLDVRGSTTSLYNVAAFYSTIARGVPTMSTATVSGISVTAGVTTSGVNFAW